ncbi:hypothetical protein F0U60_10175 [Archangium minus]|uniref:Uncharacterized protein n=1 Tax=Archangium minus TaxID=83450 RepID=A0ABY9WMP0_9BACT|nr:hypothetical protein F0U60_10175 [Archangium minus]
MITDKKILRKLIDPGLRSLYNGAVSEVARLQSRSARIEEPQTCIPESVALLITFAGPIEDLVEVGLESADAVLIADGSFVGEGLIDPMRMGELAAIPHVRTIRFQPEIAFEGGWVQPATPNLLPARIPHIESFETFPASTHATLCFWEWS